MAEETKQEKRYCIAGYCVIMTPTQAELWNQGDTNMRKMCSAYVAYPNESTKPLGQAMKSSIFRNEVCGYPAEESN